jgi:tRNA(Arg) A34 adenosine deaminase TadA
MNSKDFMQRAIDLSIKSVENGGGPFGAVIVKDGEIIAECSNSVTNDNDPTAHAEVNAIRMATKKLNNFDLTGCEIYSSCEPCPMCLGAIYWARIDKLFYANNREDAQNIGFDDSFIYEELEKPIEKRRLLTTLMMREEAMKAFKLWSQKSDKIEY